MRLIDADALMRDIEKYHVSDGKFQHWVQIQPTIEPEREKGEWIPVTNGRGGHECNKCHNYAPAWQTEGWKLWNPIYRRKERIDKEGR